MAMSVLLYRAFVTFTVSTNPVAILVRCTLETPRRCGTFRTPGATASRRRVIEVHRCQCQRMVPAERVPSPQYRNAVCGGMPEARPCPVPDCAGVFSGPSAGYATIATDDRDRTGAAIGDESII